MAASPAPGPKLLNLPRARKVMARYRLDAIVASLPENVMYLTDTEGHLTLGLFAAAEYHAILPRREDLPPTYVCPGSIAMYLVDEPTWMPELRAYEPFHRVVAPGTQLGEVEQRLVAYMARLRERPVPAPARKGLATALADLGLARARLGMDDMRVGLYLRDNELPEATFVDAYEIFREIRAVKTPEEIRRLRQSLINAERARDEAYAHVDAGVRWGDLKKIADKALIDLGSQPVWWAGAGGPPPGKLSLWEAEAPAPEVRLQPGDAVRTDIGATYMRYYTDINRTAFLGGDIPPYYRRCQEALQAARDEYRALLRPGVKGRDVIRKLEETVRKFGVEGYTRSWGHGLGLQAYEHPRLWLEDEDVVLEENMVFNVEGGPSVLGLGGMNLECTYRITATGFELWSHDEGEILVY